MTSAFEEKRKIEPHLSEKARRAAVIE